jgi:hypothetical protein
VASLPVDSIFNIPIAGSAATHWLAKQQKNSPTQLLESTANYHFLAFFVSGESSSLAFMNMDQLGTLQLAFSPV